MLVSKRAAPLTHMPLPHEPCIGRFVGEPGQLVLGRKYVQSSHLICGPVLCRGTTGHGSGAGANQGFVWRP